MDKNIVSIHNPLISASKQILIFANTMETTHSNLSVDEVIYKVSDLIKRFEQKAEDFGASYDSIQYAKYCLCTFVDECAIRSNWMVDEWSKKSLLVSFFDEAWGGERFFEILDKALLNPSKNIYLLELIYICLQFGYKGKFSVRSEGEIELDKRKKELEKVIEKHRANNVEELFNVTYADVEAGVIRKWYDLPLWAVFSGFLIICTATFMTLNWLLDSQFDEVSQRVNALELPKIPSYEVSTPKTFPKIAPLLKSKIDSKAVTVMDSGEKSVITILGDGMFESGSDEIKDQYYSVIAIIGQELNNIPGKIVVVGYTDDNNISSIKHPSNWHLSQARADKVKEILIQGQDGKGYIVDASRVRAEGMGANNPVVPNDSPQNRAKNRRVEIVINHNSSGLVSVN